MDEVEDILQGWRLDIERRIMEQRPAEERAHTEEERRLRFRGYLDGEYDMLESVLYLLGRLRQDTQAARENVLRPYRDTTRAVAEQRYPQEQTP